MKSSPLTRDAVNYRLSAVCFAIPIVSFLGAVIFQKGIGMWGLVVCALASPLVLGCLLFKLPLPIKHAACSYLVGFVIATGLFTWGAYISLSGAQSHL